MILQVLSVFAVGAFINSIYLKRKGAELSLIYCAINSIIFGYAALILPMILVGVIFPGSLGQYVYFYYAMSMLLTLGYLIKRGTRIQGLNIRPKLTKHEFLILKLIIAILIGYLFSFIVLPARGWDAMNFYFPNALYFFFQDGITPGLNPLTFYPTFKPPFNTLYITYSYYIAQGMFANLHPFILIVGVCMTTFQISRELKFSTYYALIAVLIFLIFPFTLFLVLEFAFYQELPILFFSSAALLYTLRLSEARQTHFHLPLILSLSMGILSKLSGYAVIFLFLMSISVSVKMRRIQLLGLSLIGIYLVRKAILNIYIGTGLIVLILVFSLSLSIIAQKSSEITFPTILKILSIPAVIGILWIIFMLQIPEIGNLLTQTYLSDKGTSNPWIYEIAEVPIEVALEHGVRGSFLASLLAIFTSSAYAAHLVFPKLLGFAKLKSYPILLRWVIAYLILFYAYFSNVSLRYLVPIMVPLAIIITLGFQTIFQRMQDSDKQQGILFLFLSLTLFFIIPVFPFRVLRDGYLSFFFIFHNEHFATLSVLILLSVMLVAIIRSHIKFISLSSHSLHSLFIILILIPSVIIPSSVFVYAQVTDNSIEDIASYYHRDTMVELVDYIESLDLDRDSIILSAITPGLAYFLLQPVIDIDMVAGSREFDQNLQSMTMEQAQSFILENDIMVIVQSASSSPGYLYYQGKFQDTALMHQAYQSPFIFGFENREFVVFYR